MGKMSGPKERSSPTPQTAEGPGGGEAFSVVPYWSQLMMLREPDQALEAEWGHLPSVKSKFITTSGDGWLPQPEGLEQESAAVQETAKGLQATQAVTLLISVVVG